MAALSQPVPSLKFSLGDDDVTSTVLDALKTAFPDNLGVRPAFPSACESWGLPDMWLNVRTNTHRGAARQAGREAGQEVSHG